MPDIKPDKQMEKSITLNEKTLSGLVGLKERIGQAVEKENMEKLEQARETIIKEIAQEEAPAPAVIGPIGGVAVAQAKQQKQIENILSQGLKDIYLSLTPEKQKEFKRAGEVTAGKINKLLAQAKINLGQIIKLIKKWLALIPGINKYFLEQEAKIKADEIIKIRNLNK